MGGAHDGRAPIDDMVPSPKGEDVVSKSNMQMMIDLWLVVSLRKRELTMKKCFLL